MSYSESPSERDRPPENALTWDALSSCHNKWDPCTTHHDLDTVEAPPPHFAFVPQGNKVNSKGRLGCNKNGCGGEGDYMKV